MLCYHHTLGATESTEGRMRRLRSFAWGSNGVKVGPVVAVVYMKEGSIQDWTGQIKLASSIVVQRNIQCMKFDTSVFLNERSSFVISNEGMSASKRARYLAHKSATEIETAKWGLSYLPPVMLISVSRLRVRRTGRLDILAATAAATELNTLRVSLPPNPPPILFILTTTRADMKYCYVRHDTINT